MKSITLTGVTGILLLTLPALLQITNADTIGDPARGKQLARDCVACHGEDGNSPSPVNPKLQGQHESYLLMAMQAYKDGSRKNSLMAGAVLDKSAQDLQDIAAYFAVQGKPGTAGKKGPPPRQLPPRLRFDYGARNAQFNALLAKAMLLDKNAQTPDPAECSPSGTAIDSNDDGFLEICSMQQLQAIKDKPDANYQLVTTLDAADFGTFEPIGNCGPTGNCMVALGEFGFKGVFDGLNNSINNLTVAKPEAGGVSLFGVLAETGVVMNLRMNNVSVTARAGGGGLVGSNFGVVYNCRVSGTVKGQMAMGGLVGGSGAVVYRGAFSGTVEASQAVGGLVGDMTGAVIESSSDATVNGERGVGGLVGLSTFGAVLDSHAKGDVFGNNDVGGLNGVNTNATLRNSAAEGNVTARGANAGGLVGFNSLSTIINTFATGNVSATDAAGGLVGRNNGFVARSFAKGDVTAQGSSGSLIGVEVEGETVDLIGFKDACKIIKTWMPELLPETDLFDHFFDRNRNGFIDPHERIAENYVWEAGINTACSR